jgi:hypothetical protein
MKEELIDHIKNQLADFDQGYTEGAWESFKDKNERRKKHTLWVKIAGAAAILLISIILFPSKLSRDQNSVYKDIVTSKKSEGRHVLPTVIAPLKQQNLRHEQVAYQVGQTYNNIPVNKYNPIAVINPVLVSDTGTNAVNDNIARVPNNTTKAPETAKPKTIDDLFASEDNKPTRLTPGNPDKAKWGFGFSVGQAMDNRSKTNLYVGTHISYQINSRLALASGVAFNQLGGYKSVKLPEATVQSGKFLSGAVAGLYGIEVPLELQYKTGSRVYARAGVSAFTVISQKQTLAYTEQTVSVSNYIDDNGKEHSETITTKAVFTEAVPQAKLQQYTFITLYNFAVGYQFKISNRNALALEPYVKLPATGFSEQKLNLVQGGMRIKFDF